MAVVSNQSIPPQSQPMLGLLLDDSVFDRKRIMRISETSNLPLELHEAQSIEELKSFAETTQYDLILIDYRLPVGNGLEALDALNSWPHTRRAGKILITGEARVETAVSAMKRGCHDVLSKQGLTSSQFAEAVRTAVVKAQENAFSGLCEDDVFATLVAATGTPERARSVHRLSANTDLVLYSSQFDSAYTYTESLDEDEAPFDFSSFSQAT